MGDTRATRKAEIDDLRERIAEALAVCDRIEQAAEAWDPPHLHGAAWVSVTRKVRVALGADPTQKAEPATARSGSPSL